MNWLERARGEFGGMAVGSTANTAEGHPTAAMAVLNPHRGEAPKVSIGSIGSPLSARMLESEALHEGSNECAAMPESTKATPRTWTEGLARLNRSNPPGDVPASRWHQFNLDAARFASEWGAKAIGLGWKSNDIFGCDLYRPFARIDRAGLVWLLNGCRVVAMTREIAVIETPSGVRQTYRRRADRNPGEVVPAWELGRLNRSAYQAQ